MPEARNGNARRLPRRVVFLHSADEGYGSDRVVLAVMLWLRENGVEVRALLPDDATPGWLSEQLRSHEVEFKHAQLAIARRRYLTVRSSPRYALNLAQAALHLLEEVREFRPEVVHVNTSAVIVGAVLRLRKEVAVIWHVHEIVRRPALLAAVLRRLPLTAGVVVAVSDAVAANLPDSSRGKVRRLWNGLDPRILAPRRPTGVTNVAFVGRLSEWKGYRLFFDVALDIAQTRADVLFTIAGTPLPGEEWREKEMRDALAARRLEDRVQLAGFHPDPTGLFDETHIVAVPSTEPDPLPTVVLEAMRSGCAVVASNHGGAPEMIEDGRSGLLVTPGSRDALRDAILRLVDNPQLVSSLGDAGAQRVRSVFSTEAFRAGLGKVYGDALALLGDR